MRKNLSLFLLGLLAIALPQDFVLAGPRYNPDEFYRASGHFWDNSGYQAIALLRNGYVSNRQSLPTGEQLRTDSDILAFASAGVTPFAPGDPASGTLATTVSTTWSTAPWVITSGTGTYPTGGGTATFNTGTNSGTAVPGVVTLTLDVTPTLSNLTFNSAFQYQIGASSATSFALTTTGPNTLNVQLSNMSTLSSFAAGHVIAAQITGGGAFGLTKTGSGIVTLSATNNTYTGGTFINGGTLRITGGDGSLGATGAGNGLSFDGGILRVSTTALTSARNITLNAGGGTFELFTTATLSGTISGTGSLTHSLGSTLTLTGANTYTGPTSQSAGILTLSGVNGSTANSSSYDLVGTLNLDSSGGNNNNRINDTAGITLRGATITLTGNSGAATAETVGSLTLANGINTITVTPNAAQQASLNFAGITRQNNSTLFVRGTSLGATPAANVAQITSTASPGTLVGGGGATGTTNISILPWAIGNTVAANTLSSSFVTWDVITGRFRPLASGEYATLTSGANTSNNTTMSAATAINAATTVNSVRITGTGTLLSGTGGLNITSGALLYSPATSTAGTVSANVNFGSAEGIITNSTTAVLTLSGILSGSGGLTLNNLTTGTIALTGLNTYTGQTTLLGGVYNYSGTVSNNGSTAGAFGLGTGAIILNPGGNTLTLWASAASTINRDLTITGPGLADLGTTGTTFTVTVNGNVNLLSSGQLLLDGGTTSAGAMILNGNVTGTGSLTDANSSFNILNGNNTYSGGTDIQTGTYAIGSDSTGTTGAFGTGTIYFSAAGFIQSKDATAHTVDNNILLGANPTFQGTGALTFTGGLNLNGSRTLTFSDTAVNGVTFSGLISNGAFTKAGTGTLTLSGANNTYSGGTVLSTSGTVNANAVGTLGTGTLTLSNATAIANINANQTIAGLSGATTGATVNIANNITLNLIQPSNLTYAGVISGSGALTKDGAGTLTLSGANNYSGGTTVTGGSITASSVGAIGSGSLTLNAANGVTDSVSANANQTVAGLAGTIAGNGSATLTLASGVTFTTNQTTTTSFAGTISGAGGLTKGSTGSLTLTGTNSYTGATTISGGILQLGNGGTTGSLSTSSAITDNANLTINRGNAVTQGTDFSGSAITGTGSLTKNGSGTLTLNASNTYSGGTTINNGTLILGNATNTLSNTGLVDIVAGTLSLGNNSDTVGNVILETGSITGTGGTLTGSNYDVRSGTISANLTGSGVTLFKSTSGSLSLTGTNSYSGGTTINGGDVTFDNSSALGSGSINFGPNGLDSMSLMSTTTVSLSNNITINDLSPTVGRTATLGSSSNAASGANAYTGNIVLNNTLNIKSSSPTSNALTFSGLISGSGGLIINPAGTLSPGAVTLSGANSYSGTTTVVAGTLLVNGNQSAATGAVTVNNSGTLGGSGTIGGTVTIDSGGMLAPGNSTGILQTGALTLSSGSTFSLEINGTTAGSGYDRVVSSGTINFNGSTLVITVGGTLQVNDTFFILENSSLLPNGAGAFTNGATVSSGGYTFAINYFDTGDNTPGNDISLTVLTPVPEPSTWIGGGLALAAIGFIQRRRFAKRRAGWVKREL